MAKDIAIIQVCFNVLDPYQRQLYERAASFPNRSGYVKRLIQWDAERETGLIRGEARNDFNKRVVVMDDFQAEGFI